jgi:hypothetical protein
VGIATHSPTDQLVLDMLQVALNASDKPLATLATSEEAVEHAIKNRVDLSCIVSLSPTRGAEVRGYCRQLRARCPSASLLVLRPLPNEAGASRSAARMKEAGASMVVTTIADALLAIEELDPAVSSGSLPSAVMRGRPAQVQSDGEKAVKEDHGASLTPAR